MGFWYDIVCVLCRHAHHTVNEGCSCRRWRGRGSVIGVSLVFKDGFAIGMIARTQARILLQYL